MNLANKLTTIRLFLVPVFVVFAIPMPDWMANQNAVFHFISQYNIIIATIIFIIAAITDKLDGYVARKYNQITALGCFLDPLADKLIVSAALLVLVEQGKITSWIAIIILTREFAVTALRVTAAYNKKILAADKFGKIKLVCQVVTIPICLLNDFPFSLITSFPVYMILMYITVIVTVLSGINYFVNNKEVFYEHGKLTI